ncbi:MAG: substrate-binding domain-containing protein [Hydrogenophaga sp.]|uniref:substrate-binding domain-containing protein n=1 Tax=Hydrogenophaga sp. TaxID=1904254 RepID=UPI0025C3E22C|nr:substrate-binding domain-containing protein [Hydrogenophaga sp.]MBT9549968.1 substrate-binding domain-containing protein [Hydrogenophaga sp.]
MTAGPVLRVLAPQAFSHALDALAKHFTDAGGPAVAMGYGPATGSSERAITARLDRGEVADVVLLPTRLLEERSRTGLVLTGTCAEVLRSGIGLCVHVEQPLPLIGTLEELRLALLRSRSVALSQAGSGEYVAGQLLQRLGIDSDVLGRCQRFAHEPVAAVVARGDAELGFQQVCELLPVPGIRFVGALPEAVQHRTAVSAGVLASSAQPGLALSFVRHLRSQASVPVLAAAGLDAAADL